MEWKTIVRMARDRFIGMNVKTLILYSLKEQMNRAESEIY